MIRKKIIIFIILCLTVIVWGKSIETAEQERELDNTFSHNISNTALRVSNYGFIGSDDSYPSLEWPYNGGLNPSGIEYLYQGALWVGAKKLRRNSEGTRLFWPPDPEDGFDVVAEYSAEYDSLVAEFGSLLPVLDTLTSVGFDGDHSVYELLPAYNPLEMGELGYQFDLYNTYDNVVVSNYQLNEFDDDGDSLIDEDPAGAFFDINDPDSIFCFTKPCDDDMDGLLDEDSGYHGYQTSVAYYYDYSPFGSPGERDYGSYSQNDHFPLNIAVARETYTWPVQYYADMVILKHQIYNANVMDTLYDVCLGFMMDADIGPQNWSIIYDDDVSSYVSGGGNEFAYSYDADGDGGLSPGYVAMKILNYNDYNYSCWTWGEEGYCGPEDYDPLDIWPGGIGVVYNQRTANEKYWLLESRSPNDDDFTSLIDYPEHQIGNPGDTRFLYSIYGDQCGFDDPSAESINIPPGESIELYTAIFLSTSIDGLQNLSITAQELYESGFDYSLMEGLPSLPHLNSVENTGDGNSVFVRWNCLTSPDDNFVCYKLTDAPAIDWEYIQIDNDIREYYIENLETNETYNVKIAVEFGEVYLESNEMEITVESSSVEGDELAVEQIIHYNYPNPFAQKTQICYQFPGGYEGKIEISIYNLKGQNIYSFPEEQIRDKKNYKLIWNGKDRTNKPVSDGIYIYKISYGNNSFSKKMIKFK